MSNQRQLSSTTYPINFLMVDSTDHITGKTGLTVTVTLSKNGAAFGSAAGAVTEISSGWYSLAANATDRNTLGELGLHATATGADPTDKTYEITAGDPFGFPGALRSGTMQSGSTATSAKLDSGASATTNLYSGCLLVITSGTGAGQARTITAYNGSSKQATVDRAWTTTPDNTSVFAVLAGDDAALNASLQVTTAPTTTAILAGTASAGTTNTLTLTGGLATNSVYVGDVLTLTGGTGLGQTRTIIAYNGTSKVATVDRNWTTTPDNTTTFNVLANITPTTFSDQGVAQAASASTITLAATASATSGIYVGSIVSILSGTDAGDTSVITAYNGSTKVATVSPNFAVTPDTTSAYAVIPTQSGTGQTTGVADVNVFSWGQTPVTNDSNGKPSMSVGGYATGQDPNTLWQAGAMATCTGLPTTNGQALTYSVQQRNNKEHFNKTTGVGTLYENDGTTAKMSQTYTSDATTADRTAAA